MLDTKSYVNGNCILQHGDCLEKMSEIGSESIDIIRCDLPYGVTQNHWDCPVDEKRLWEQYRRIINIDDALIEGLSQNQDFFTLLLQNEEIKKEVLGIFADEIYKSLRKEG